MAEEDNAEKVFNAYEEFKKKNPKEAMFIESLRTIIDQVNAQKDLTSSIEGNGITRNSTTRVLVEVK